MNVLFSMLSRKSIYRIKQERVLVKGRRDGDANCVGEKCSVLYSNVRKLVI